MRKTLRKQPQRTGRVRWQSSPRLLGSTTAGLYVNAPMIMIALLGNGKGPQRVVPPIETTCHAHRLYTPRRPSSLGRVWA